MALMATEEGAGTGEVVALAGARVHGTRTSSPDMRTQIYNRGPSCVDHHSKITLCVTPSVTPVYWCNGFTPSVTPVQV